LSPPLRLWRAHGLGNDYAVLEGGPEVTAPLVRALCDRHRGCGADGILEPLDAAEADYGVRIWNPDGSLAEKSGNGLRIFARWAQERLGAPRLFSVHTGFDSVVCEVDEDDISVQMGRASFDPSRVPILAPAPMLDEPWFVDGDALNVSAVGVGNPHLVVFVDGDLDDVDWRRFGPLLENNARSPNRTNVQFAKVLGPGQVEIRIWERGAGPTLASGSSSCAVAAVAVRTGRLDTGPIAVHMPGGTLTVIVDSSFGIVLRGPVEVIGVTEIDPRWLERRLRERAD
jgi:diaminopimelate epimerase